MILFLITQARGVAAEYLDLYMLILQFGLLLF